MEPLFQGKVCDFRCFLSSRLENDSLFLNCRSAFEFVKFLESRAEITNLRIRLRFLIRKCLKGDMKTRFMLSAMVLLWVAISQTGLAMMSVSEVSKEKAEEMGIKVHSKAAGPERVWVEIEFEKEGQIKGFDPDKFSRVELRVLDGEESKGGKILIRAALQMKKLNENSLQVGFYLARNQVPQTKVMIIVGSGLMPGGGFDLDLKEFVSEETIGKP